MIPPKLAILVSGNGSNLQSIIDHIESKKLDAHIAVVVSNIADVFALERAKKAGVPTVVLPHRDFSNRESFDAALADQLQKFNVQWVVLAGFMRILGKNFVTKYAGKIINIHPSLLPKYPGHRAIETALANRDSETGVTVHYVDEGVDTGNIILQESVTIEPHDTIDTLRLKIHAVEHQIYPKRYEKCYVTNR